LSSDNSVHSFLLDRNGFTTIDVPGAIGTNALRINAQGEIVGFYVPSSGTGRGFLWRRGTFSDITAEVPGALGTHGTGTAGSLAGINATGDIVGFYRDLAGRDHGFLLPR